MNFGFYEFCKAIKMAIFKTYRIAFRFSVHAVFNLCSGTFILLKLQQYLTLVLQLKCSISLLTIRFVLENVLKSFYCLPIKNPHCKQWGKQLKTQALWLFYSETNISQAFCRLKKYWWCWFGPGYYRRALRCSYCRNLPHAPYCCIIPYCGGCKPAPFLAHY